MNLKKVFTVAYWEYNEKIKTKAFILSMIITPMIIIAFALLPTLLSDQEDDRTRMIGLLEPTNTYFFHLNQELQNYFLTSGQPLYILTNLYKPNLSIDSIKKSADRGLISGELDGYIYIADAGTDSVRYEYRSKSLGNFRDLRNIEDAVNKVRIKLALRDEGVNPEVAAVLLKDVNLNQIIIEKSGKESESDFMLVFFSSFIFIILLMMMVIYSGQMLVRSLLEEKSNRLIEILISSCSTDELLSGKILGLSMLGLTQIFIWAMIGIALTGQVIPPEAFNNVLPMLVYFILGFIFYTTIFVGIGSIVSTEQEAQQVTSYLSLMLMLPVVIAVPAIQNPESVLVKILTYIPITLPSVMLLRFNISEVPLWEIISTILIMLVSISLSVYFSSKIFRIGILSYGKRPSIKVILKWLKEK
ncbi:MAG: ABC transporter permease [Ignavibacteriaceae bacterium]